MVDAGVAKVVEGAAMRINWHFVLGWALAIFIATGAWLGVLLWATRPRG